MVWLRTLCVAAVLLLSSTVAGAQVRRSEEGEIARAIVRAGGPEERAGEWAGYFVRYAKETGTDPRWLVAIAMHESAWNPRAYNSGGGGSYGLMQVLPARWLSKYSPACGVPATASTLRNPRVSICYGAHVYAYWHSVNPKDRSRALRGYNSGFRYLRNNYDRKVALAYQKLFGG